MSRERIVIEVCMGSSCYSRSNKKNLEIIRSYLAEADLEDRVDLVGRLCANQCKDGPNIFFNGRRHNPSVEALPDLLRHYLPPAREHP